jgi:hypothetical protein
MCTCAEEVAVAVPVYHEPQHSCTDCTWQFSWVTNSASQWPKVAQSDIQEYMKVFAGVDKDRDIKITCAEARTLFLSWRLPRGRIP